MTTNSVYLYIFSGPHLGAKIALKSGKTIIGSDDSADIILYAQKASKDFAIAARHAVIEVSPSVTNDNFITIEELDGKIFIENIAEAQETIQIAPGQIFYLASTCMVWNYIDAVQEYIVPNLANAFTDNKVSTTSETDEAISNNIGDSLEENVLSTEENVENILSPEELAKKAEKKKKRKVVSLTSFYVIAIATCLGLSVYIEPQHDNLGIETDYLVTQLAKNGIDSVDVQKEVVNKSESIVISGYLDSAKQRNELQDLARTLQYPVYLDVNVKSDMLRAVQDSFELTGVFVQSAFDNEKIKISGYIHDAIIEELAFSNLEHDVKDLPEVERNIIHATELAEVIEKEFELQDIAYSDIIYEPSQISIQGDFNSDKKKKIHTIMNEIMDKNSIPLLYSLKDVKLIAASQLLTEGTLMPKPRDTNKNASPIEVREQAAPQQAEARSTEPLSGLKNTEPLGGLKITSVNLGLMPFVSTSDGQRLFKGALLPSGFTIEEIYADSLELRKGTQVTHIDLQSSN